MLWDQEGRDWERAKNGRGAELAPNPTPHKFAHLLITYQFI